MDVAFQFTIYIVNKLAKILGILTSGFDNSKTQ